MVAEEIVEIPAPYTSSECFDLGPSIGKFRAVRLGRITEKNKLPVACHHYARPPVARP